jgi:hypothetical protein
LSSSWGGMRWGGPRDRVTDRDHAASLKSRVVCYGGASSSEVGEEAPPRLCTYRLLAAVARWDCAPITSYPLLDRQACGLDGRRRRRSQKVHAPAPHSRGWPTSRGQRRAARAQAPDSRCLAGWHLLSVPEADDRMCAAGVMGPCCQLSICRSWPELPAQIDFALRWRA